MRTLLTVTVMTVLITGGAGAGPATATTLDDDARQSSSTPSAFRWVPFPGLPDARYCAVRANDVGAALVSLASESGEGSVWVARASGARRLTLPDGYRSEGIQHGALSPTGIAALPVSPPLTDTDPLSMRIVRWDAHGTPQLSPPFPPAMTSSNPVRAQVIGVTAAGDVVINALRTFGHDPDGTLFVWTADGALRDLGALPAVDWYGNASQLRPDGSFVVAWNYAFESFSELFTPTPGWTSVTRTRIAPAVDALSGDGRWWAGRMVTGTPNPEGPPDVKAVLGTAKGLNAPMQPLPAAAIPGQYARPLGINNQGTMLITGTTSAVRWVNGTRITDVLPRVTRLPSGATVSLLAPPHIDTAGRLTTSVVTSTTCRAGVLAPEW